jgi:hypothetical protein
MPEYTKEECYKKNNDVGNGFVMLVVSIGGCWVGWEEGSRRGRDGKRH